MRRIEAYDLSPEQEAEIIAEIAFENEYNRLLIEGVDRWETMRHRKHKNARVRVMRNVC